MQSSILIDTSGDNETRILVLEGREIQEYKQEANNSNRLTGNIYLARIDKIEPSIQAAFVELGTGRHGFLPFRAIHPDYYNLADIIQEDLEIQPNDSEEQATNTTFLSDFSDFTQNLSEIGFPFDKDSDETLNGGDGKQDYPSTHFERGQPAKQNDYLIQDVIEQGQIVLVQVTRDEFHAKGPALTTYISLPSKYCVYLPNSRKGFSISNKIHSQEIRDELKNIFNKLHLPDDSGLIMRTIKSIPLDGAIEKDYLLLRQKWQDIIEKSQNCQAPTLIQQEGDIIERTLRDYFRDGLDKIIVQGERGYERSKEIVKALAPDEIDKVQLHVGTRPLFVQWGAYDEIRMLHQPIVQLKSGGHLVIETTEALVSIDINSAKSNQSSSLAETALKTNLEAAEEIARQLRLRDLAGIIVIDFIDMDSWHHRKEVQDLFRNALKRDQAWINTSPISRIGLLEMTRQRTGEDLVGHTTKRCPACDGTGRILLDETIAFNILRHVEAECSFRKVGNVNISVSSQISEYLLNEQRKEITRIEDIFGCRMRFEVETRWNSRDYAFRIYNADKEKLTFKFDSRTAAESYLNSSHSPRLRRKSRGQTRSSQRLDETSQYQSKNSRSKNTYERHGDSQSEFPEEANGRVQQNNNPIGSNQINVKTQTDEPDGTVGQKIKNPSSKAGVKTASSEDPSISTSGKEPTRSVKKPPPKRSRRSQKKAGKKQLQEANEKVSEKNSNKNKNYAKGKKAVKNAKTDQTLEPTRKTPIKAGAQNETANDNNHQPSEKQTSTAKIQKQKITKTPSGHKQVEHQMKQNDQKQNEISQVLNKIAPANEHSIGAPYFTNSLPDELGENANSR